MIRGRGYARPTATLGDGGQTYMLSTDAMRPANSSADAYARALVAGCGVQDLGRGAPVPANWTQLALPQPGLFAPAGQNLSASAAACFSAALTGVSTPGHHGLTPGATMGLAFGLVGGIALAMFAYKICCR
jgi:hypothetical protein